METVRVTSIMGGKAVLGVRAVSIHELADTVALGLPKLALRTAARRVFSRAKEANALMYKLVPEATYKRRTRLTPAESEKTERLARVIAAAETAWEDRKEANQWLTTAHPELGGKTPLERSMSELGAREVEELLDKLLFGLPS